MPSVPLFPRRKKTFRGRTRFAKHLSCEKLAKTADFLCGPNGRADYNEGDVSCFTRHDVLEGKFGLSILAFKAGLARSTSRKEVVFVRHMF